MTNIIYLAGNTVYIDDELRERSEGEDDAQRDIRQTGSDTTSAGQDTQLLIDC